MPSKDDVKGMPIPVRFNAAEVDFIRHASALTDYSEAEIIRRGVRLLMRLNAASGGNVIPSLMGLTENRK